MSDLYIKIRIEAFLLTILFLSSCSSCVIDPEIVSVFGGELAVPKYTGISVVSSSEVDLRFSGAVSVSAAEIVLQDSPDTIVPVTWEQDYRGTDIVFQLEKPIDIGASATISVTVADSAGDSLSLVVPFIGFNDRVPALLINEVRTVYAKPKVEYIELYILEDGNLGGVEIYNAMNTVKPAYEFPAVEVSAGDYVVYHLRSIEEGVVDETDSLDASSGKDASDNARDFWDTQTKAPLKKNNVVLVRERKDGRILDAFLCAEDSLTDWPSDTVVDAAAEAVTAGTWGPTSSVADAVCSTGTTATRTIGRDAESTDTNTAADWKICKTGKCSPGKVNN